MMFVPHWKHSPPLPVTGDSFALLLQLGCKPVRDRIQLKHSQEDITAPVCVHRIDAIQ
jgi:hypothetical protein